MYTNLKSLLKSERLRLTSLNEKDILSMEQWYNNVDFLRLYDMTMAFPKSSAQLYEMLNEKRKSNNSYIFAIRTLDEDKFIGVAGFENILWNNGTSVVFIGLGDEECRGKGYGKEAMQMLLNFGFQELNLHRIQLDVLSYNKAAIKLYESLGFKREGVYREFIHRDGKRYDMYLYGLLRYEVENNM
ncbi:GNAT family N-acetyltransferase [Clostridium scatologenes]|uniref:GCN5-related N-acetyltransferase n=1 Tax=Clostridium scatologenes TaxID=1548 RepID=A0A0E3GR66_CLOSL|nr:GNAT family protein [Clostridium scatologenes]AKA69786.1 GCN5-related N-acetyltransferase [Clostridium scatologenes]